MQPDHERPDHRKDPPPFREVFEQIRADAQNAAYTSAGIDPLYAASPTARLVVIGQAPGRVAQETMIPWNDRSGDRLRDWMGVDRATFYDAGRVAIIPMDFYFPGTGRSGDLPPRRGFAQRWHPRLLGLMPDVRLRVLVGSYAVRHYLGLPASTRLTDVVRDYRAYLPGGWIPLVHPSPRNRAWLRDNPWFEADVVPALREAVRAALGA